MKKMVWLVLWLISVPWIPARNSAAAPSGPAIHSLRTNLAELGGRVPRYAKLELSFQVDTVAQNLQLPYDPAPPPGLAPGIGISVDAQFSPDGWRTVYTQPAFLYQEFEDRVKGGQEWFYPTSSYSWKVRFAPTTAGTWEYRLLARDSSGQNVTAARSFQVVPSDRKGFIRVSAADPRYFEYEDGTYFPALGYNMNFGSLSWTNPVLDNAGEFERMAANGVQLIRVWLSQWSIYGSAWSPWNSPDPEKHARYIPEPGLTTTQAFPGSEVSMRLEVDDTPCMFVGFQKPRPAVKRETAYRVRVRYRTIGLAGPVRAGSSYGLVAKIGGWLWGEEDERCDQPGTGTPATPYQAQNSSGWQILEGRLITGDQDFLPNFYLALENARTGQAYIDTVWIEEDLGNGSFGPNILSKPWMAQHLYMDQRASYAFDKVLELAEQNGVALRPVILEKNEWIANRINWEGELIPDDPRCRDEEGSSDPEQCPGNGWFYGDLRRETKGRWLQQAWWRYLQARWGYSTSIHSWELLNEGDPASERHFVLADELGKYMRQFVPDHHPVSTSFWHSFPREEFWANPNYEHVDFADIHGYAEGDDPGYRDTALWSYEASMAYGALQPGGAGKPLLRGETGFVDSGNATPEFKADREGIWLHNFIWAGINPGGMIEAYWFDRTHLYRTDDTGKPELDLRYHYKAYYNFIHDLPLNNGRYQDAQAQVSNSRLQAWGQKDLSRGRAHLWIRNLGHTWKRALSVLPIRPVSGEVSLPGFGPSRSYRVEWWDTFQPDSARQVLRIETVQAGADGEIRLRVQGLERDIAVRIEPER